MKEVTDRHNAAIDEDDEETIKMCDERICKLHELRKGVLKLSRGERDDFGGTFVKEVVVKLSPQDVIHQL
jgi:hypothetical protein